MDVAYVGNKASDLLLLNRVNYTAPSGNRSTAAFGTITSTYDPRQMQFGVKVLW